MAIALFSCSAPAPVPPAVSTVSSTVEQREVQAQQIVGTFFAAARAGDRPAFRRTLSSRDPIFADRARLLFDNLSGLPLTRLEARLEAGPRPLTSARQAVLGPDAWAQPVTVSWQLVGEPAAAVHTVWLTFAPTAGGVEIAGTADTPAAPSAPQPSWWLGPVTTARSVVATVMTGAGQSPDRWMRLAEQARAAVRRHLPATVLQAAGPLVVAVPATQTDFEAVVGVPAGSYADIAAVTLAEGPAATAAVHIVVNPAAARRLTADGLALTLAHESVHVVTRSPSSPAPTWAVEGLADYVALRAYPAAGATVDRPLRSAVKAQGPPDRLPADADYAADADRLDLAYAQAWSVCRYVAERYSTDRLGRLYRALDRGRTVDQAATETLGVSESELTTGWRRELADEVR